MSDSTSTPHVSGWEVRYSKSKNLPYFYQASTGTSRWQAPEDLSEKDIQHLPGAAYIWKLPPADGMGHEVHDGQVRASHLLIKHSESRRAASWKNPQITISKEEAIQKLQGYLEELRSLSPEELPKKFAEIASTESDCSSHSKGGDLGWFGKGQMQKPFEEATYALQPGQMSDIIDTDSGVHLILRTG